MQPSYKCFNCEKKVSIEYLRVRIRCPYCGDRRVFKERNTITKIKAR